MNPKRSFKRFLTGCLALAAIASLAINASAQSFGVTNKVQASTQYTTYPTNATGLKTGVPVDVSTYEIVGLKFEGDVVNTNSAVVGFTLIRSGHGSSPGDYTNWASAPSLHIPLTIAVQTNHFILITNTPAGVGFLAGANYIGFSSMTNNLEPNCVISNWTVVPIKKRIPMTWP